jgi:hypothetical protein
MEILLLGAELFHADGRTDGQTDRHCKSNGRFLQFSESVQKFFYWEQNCSMPTDGRADIANLMVAFCNFPKRTKI